MVRENINFIFIFNWKDVILFAKICSFSFFIFYFNDKNVIFTTIDKNVIFLTFYSLSSLSYSIKLMISLIKG